MSAPITVMPLFHAPLDPALNVGRISPPGTLRSKRGNCSGQIKHVLKSAGLSMTEVSAQTRKRFGDRTAYFIPPTFRYKQKLGISPHICQIVALSEITGHRFADVMAAFGFDLGVIFALQLRIHEERTVLVTPDTAPDSSAPITNSAVLKWSRRHLFAKIGTRDAVAYPRVRPGSVIRADREISLDVAGSSQEHLWLVEHPGGLVCCHVKRIDRENVVLLPNRPPLSAWPLRLSEEVRILGRVDLELWPGHATGYEPDERSTRYQMPRAMVGKRRFTFSEMLRNSRSRAGLTLRKAHEMTRNVSELLEDDEYSIALGLLSDYEAMNRVPRHIAKIMSLCVIYGIDFWELMETAGIKIDEGKRHKICA